MAKSSNKYDKMVLDSIVSGIPLTKEQLKKITHAKLYEADIQKECIDWFKLAYPSLWSDGVLYHIANEGKRTGRNGKGLVNTGLVKGVADLCLAVGRHGFHALYIEMKRDGTYQKPSQKKWEAGITKYGNKYVVCRSCDEFAKIVNEYLKEKP